MPLYEYHCLDCQSRFEKLSKHEAADAMTCPTCGGKRARRLLSVFASFSRSGDGAPVAMAGGGGGCACGGNCGCGGH